MPDKRANLSGQEALERLRAGNERFANNIRSNGTPMSQAERAALTEGQNPFAIILGCSDSRVPAELVFDQGFGSLFVIRVAGNIVAPSQVGSVEFAATQYNTRLVIVLGHTQCGAVSATLDELRNNLRSPSRNQRSIVERIAPAVATLMETPLRDDPEALMKHAVRANIRAATSHLRHGSEILENLIANENLLVVSAEYSLETGVVEFFDVP
ncbi:carbonic anhydrase [Thiothrix lacustris]|jgi:carbonic anhydrase|uniref:carbonic anhydrase n=1 Tax=Thiothrix lacustris TaxID=525917 RepID=A0ABY9MSC3_9GAMM|nr:carbonic anhydrase [Thiothrix lacustris]WML91413.1 carbonic anhydrase [Thiothrix lacustris]